MTTTPDAIVIGAGPNGLVAANRLVDAGWSVTVFEAKAEPGGAIRTEELVEAGFRNDVFSAFYPLARASPILRALELERYGLRWCEAPVVLAHPFPDGRCAMISKDPLETAESLESFAPADGAAWRLMMEAFERIEGPLLAALFSPWPPLGQGARLVARLGWENSFRFARHMLLPARRMAEELFEGEGAAMLLAGLGLHSDLAPEATGSGFFGWLLCCLGARVGFPVPQGGAGALSQALAERFAAHGGVLVCDAPVVEVLIDAGTASGVVLADGRRITARRAVIADVAAWSLFFELVGEAHLPPSFARDLRRFEWDPATVKIDWTLSGPIPWRAPAARRAGALHLADDLDNLTEYAADLAMRRLPARPYLVFGQQSVADPTRSPAGTAIAWAYTRVPRSVKADAAGELDVATQSSGEDPRWLPGFVERIEARVESLAPGFRQLIRGRHVLSPSAMEQLDPNLSLGAFGGGTTAPHQQVLFRPVPGMGRAETPVARLYLASASAHPGGGVHGAPGSTAARAALLALPRARSIAFGRGERRRPRPG